MKMRFKVGDIDSLLNISFNFELIFFFLKRKAYTLLCTKFVGTNIHGICKQNSEMDICHPPPPEIWIFIRD